MQRGPRSPPAAENLFPPPLPCTELLLFLLLVPGRAPHLPPETLVALEGGGAGWGLETEGLTAGRYKLLDTLLPVGTRIHSLEREADYFF